MPQEPKKRHSRQRQGKRRAAIHLTVKNAVACLNCGKMNPPHTACRSCGYYKDKDVRGRKIALNEAPKTEVKEESQKEVK